ncbi:hypothetical protein [Clostridium oceanicum]|uniref:Integral membrane protein n=1 Tax=Clostridium oceanicum TaxID=1543 RepID=A0ABP3UFL0_9CLOT
MSIIILSLKMSIIQILYFLGIFIGIGIILGFLEKKINKNMQRAFGWNGVLMTAVIGTPVHEIGHMLMCLIFNHRVNKVCLLNTSGKNGYLGYVQHSFNRSSIYQRIGNFFIAMGPLFSGLIVLLTSMYFFIPKSFKLFVNYLKNINPETISLEKFLSNSFSIYKYIFNMENIKSVNFWIFLFIAISLSAHIALSLVDMKNQIEGLKFIFAVIFMVNIVIYSLNLKIVAYLRFVIYYNQIIFALFSITLIFSVLTYLISKILALVKSRNVY